MKIISATLSILGLLVMGAAWSMAVNSTWPLVLLFGVSVLLSGLALGFAVVTGILKERQARIMELARRELDRG